MSYIVRGLMAKIQLHRVDSKWKFISQQITKIGSQDSELWLLLKRRLATKAAAPGRRPSSQPSSQTSSQTSSQRHQNGSQTSKLIISTPVQPLIQPQPKFNSAIICCRNQPEQPRQHASRAQHFCPGNYCSQASNQGSKLNRMVCQHQSQSQPFSKQHG